MSLFETLLQQQQQAQQAQQAQQRPVPRSGLEMLLGSAQRTAGMLGNQIGNLTGTDTRPKSVRDMEQINAIVREASGDTEIERIENSLSEIAEINPALAMQLQGKLRTTQAKQGVAQRLASQGHSDLATAYLAGELTADQAITEARQRTTAERQGQGSSKVTAPTSNEISLFTGLANQSPDITSKLEAMAEREDAGWLYNITGGRIGSEGDIKEGSREDLIRVAAFRAKEIKAQNPETGTRQAFQQAINEMHSEFSNAGEDVQTGTQAVETNTPMQPEDSTFGQAMNPREAARSLASQPIGSVARVQLPNGNRINIRLDQNGQVIVLPNSATEEDMRVFQQSLQSLRNN